MTLASLVDYRLILQERLHRTQSRARNATYKRARMRIVHLIRPIAPICPRVVRVGPVENSAGPLTSRMFIRSFFRFDITAPRVAKTICEAHASKTHCPRFLDKLPVTYKVVNG